MARGSQINEALGTQAALAVLGDISTAVSAAGTTQGTATALTSSTSIVTTCAAFAGVRLPVTPTVSARDRIFVANHTANTLACYPPVGGKLSAQGTNVPALIPPGKGADFICLDGTNYTALLGA